MTERDASSSGGARWAPAQPSLFGDVATVGYRPGTVWDELVTASGEIRPHWQFLVDRLAPFDLGRARDGEWWVLAARAQSPSAAGVCVTCSLEWRTRPRYLAPRAPCTANAAGNADERRTRTFES